MRHPRPQSTRALSILGEFNGRLCSLLMPALPEEVKAVIMDDLDAESDTSNEASAVAMSDDIWHQVSPGGLSGVKWPPVLHPKSKRSQYWLTRKEEDPRVGLCSEKGSHEQHACSELSREGRHPD